MYVSRQAVEVAVVNEDDGLMSDGISEWICMAINDVARVAEDNVL